MQRRTWMLANINRCRVIPATLSILLFALLALAGGALGVGAPALARPTAAPPPTDPRPAGKIDPTVLADTANGQSSPVVILLADQADLSAAYTMKDQDA